jgi:hypothetical protein
MTSPEAHGPPAGPPPPGEPREPQDALDVDALMRDLRGRVAEKKARGLYGVDALLDEGGSGTEPFSLEDLERLRALSVLEYDVEVGPSSTGVPVIGGLVTQAKRSLVRGVSQPGYSLAAQINAYHGALLAYLTRLAREITALGTRVDEAAARAEQAADAVREAEIERQRDLGQLEGRVEELAALLAAAEERISRLEAGGDAAA